MYYVLFMVGQLSVLYLLSKQLERQLWLIAVGSGYSPKRAVWVMQILFWPGVLIHELAHLVVGRLLLVKTGHLTVMPRMEDGHITMGSVEVPTTDVFRFMLIGVAPVYVGLAVIFGSIWLSETYQLWSFWWWWIINGWLMFEVGNTMFTSRSDLAWALRLTIILFAVGGLTYWFGWRPGFNWLEPWLNSYGSSLSLAQYWLWLPILVDLGVISILWLINKHISYGPIKDLSGK